MLPPPPIMTRRTGRSMRRSSCSTLRMFPLAAMKNTSSPSSTTVVPSGAIGLSWRKIAATRMSTFGMCWRRYWISCPTRGPPWKARTATRPTFPPANSSTCSDSGNSSSFTM